VISSKESSIFIFPEIKSVVSVKKDLFC